MRKKICSLLLVPIMMLIMPISVFAADRTGDIKVDCSQTIPLGSTVSCAIYGQTSDNTSIIGGQFSVSASGAIKIVSGEKDSSWTNGEFTDNKLTVNGTEQSSPAKLGTIVISTADGATTGSTGQLTLSEIEVAAYTGETAEGSSGALTVADKNIVFTVGNTSSNTQSNGSTTTSGNPKTMDTNVIIITMIVALAAGVVIIGKKKLDKISK